MLVLRMTVAERNWLAVGRKKKLLFDVFCALGHGREPGPQEVPHQGETGRLEPRNINIQYFGRRPDDELSQQEREEPKNQ